MNRLERIGAWTACLLLTLGIVLSFPDDPKPKENPRQVALVQQVKARGCKAHAFQLRLGADTAAQKCSKVEHFLPGTEIRTMADRMIEQCKPGRAFVLITKKDIAGGCR